MTDKKSIFKKILWQIYDKSSLRLVCEKFIPPKEKKIERRPSSLIMWMFGIYFAAFGIASNRYENRIDKIENHANFIIAQLGTPNYKKALAMIPGIQNRKCPNEPKVGLNLSIIYSFMESKETKYKEIAERMKGIIEIWRDSLNGVNLSFAYLENADLKDANLEKANLFYANLENADLTGANLDSVFLIRANLENADLTGARLENAFLSGVNLENAILQGANLENAFSGGVNLENAYLQDANLENADLKFANFNDIKLVPISETGEKEREETKEDIIKFIKQLEKADDVEGIQLDNEIMDIIKKEFHDLFKRIEGGENKIISDLMKVIEERLEEIIKKEEK